MRGHTMKDLLARAVTDLAELLPKLNALAPQLQRLGTLMLECWSRGGKVLIAGNGGSAADAMHFAEELSVRFQKDRRALAAMALCDPTVLTCAANDFGFERVFARQVEAFGNRGDVLIVISTSGNSPNIVRAAEQARSQGLVVAMMSGRDGGALRGKCDVELIVPSGLTARVQEGHKVLYHALCEWIDARVGTA
jgi:D-sedoheptulose 7-phosphate isomerase